MYSKIVINIFSSHKLIKFNGLFIFQLSKIIILLFYHLHYSLCIKVDGFSEYNGVTGGPLLLPCNTSNGAIWTNQVTMVLFYKGINGKPLFTMDRRGDTKNLSLPISKNQRRNKNISNLSLNRQNALNSNNFYYDTALNTPVYLIDSLRETDESEYRCRIDYKQSRTRNYVIKLNVIVPPKENIITNYDGQILDKIAGPIEENEDLFLTCEAFGNPAPSVFWYFDGKLIDDTFYTESKGISRNELQLNQLNRTHLNTPLTCRSQNTNLTKPTETTLNIDLILKPLKVKIVTEQKRLEADQDTTFQCIVYGAKPQPTISWSIINFNENILNNLTINNLEDNSLNNQKYNNNSNINKRAIDNLKTNIGNGLSFYEAKKSVINQIISEPENIHSSQIRFRLTAQDNGKKLICRAENTRLKNSQKNLAILQEQLELHVYYKPIVKLKLGASLHADRLREGSDLYLDCVTDSNPPVNSVRFLKDGQLVQQETGVLISNQTLVLQQVRRRFRGLYTCEASNSVGKSQSNSLFLRIQHAPVCALSLIPTKSVASNEQIEFVCQVYADPPVNHFRWYLNNSSETIELSSNSALFNQTTLKLPSTEFFESTFFEKNKTLNSFISKSNRYYSQNLSSSSTNSFHKNPHNNLLSKTIEYDNQIFISVGRINPNRFDFGTVSCRAENLIGIQQEPCIFHLIPAGPPLRLEQCLVSNHSLTSLIVHCPSSNNLNNFSDKIKSSIAHHVHQNSMSSLSSIEQPSITLNNLYMAIVYESETNILVLNFTRKQPYFVFNSLRPATQYTVLLYALNGQGKSPVYRLHTATLGPPEKRQMSQLNDQLEENTYNFLKLNFHHNYVIIFSSIFIILFVFLTISIRCFVKNRDNTKTNRSNFKKFNKSEPDLIPQDVNSLKLSSIKGSNGSNNLLVNKNNDNYHSLRSICKNNLDLKDEKCEVICESNENDFVSVEYKSIPWENEDSFKRFETDANNVYQPSIGVITYELDNGLNNIRALNTVNFNRLSSNPINSMKNQVNTSLYNSFNQLSLGQINNSNIICNEQHNTLNLGNNIQQKTTNGTSASLITTNNAVATNLLPLQLHNSTNQSTNLENTILPNDNNSFNNINSNFHQLANSIPHQPHLTNSTELSINNSSMNLNSMNTIGLSNSVNNNTSGELYNPLDVQMYNNYTSDNFLHATRLALDNLYSQNLNNTDTCNLDPSVSMFQQQQIAMHLVSNLGTNNFNNQHVCSNNTLDQEKDPNIQLQR